MFTYDLMICTFSFLLSIYLSTYYCAIKSIIIIIISKEINKVSKKRKYVEVDKPID